MEMVTNTSNISIRVGHVVVSPHKSMEVDGDALAKLRHEDASPAAQALGEALVDGVPTVKKMTTKEQKAEASKIIADAKVKADSIIDEANKMLAEAELEVVDIKKSMVDNKKALAMIGK